MTRYENDLGNKEFIISERRTSRVQMHWHAYYEVEFCISGEGTQYINGVKDSIEHGVLTFLSPKDFHRIETTNGPLHIITFCFYSHMLSANMIKLITDNSPPFRIKLVGEDYDRMMSAYRSLEAESKLKDSFHDRTLKYRIGLICVDIIRTVLKNKMENSYPNLCIKENGTFEMIAEDIVPYINENYDKKLSRDELAERLHLNPTYFSETFKKYLGISYTDYITNVRMNEAMRMLKYTDKSANEIMIDVGYHSPSAFYKKFKACFGMLPGEVKRYGNEKE